jgi:extracellular elastinolytic metalloproteinase
MLPTSLVLSTVLALVPKRTQESFPAIYFPSSQFQLQTNNPQLNKQMLTRDLEPQQLQLQSLDWVKGNLQFAQGDDVAVQSSYLDSASRLYHCYMIKKHQGLDVVNSMVQMTTDRKGNLVAVGSQWDSSVQPARLLKRQQGLGCRQALDVVQKSLNFTENPIAWNVTTVGDVTRINNVRFADEVTCREKFYQTRTELRQILDLAVPMSAQYLNVMVDKQNGQIHAAVDWSSDFTFNDDGRLQKRQNNPEFRYRVLQIGALDPRTVAPRVQTNPADPIASPEGWHVAGRSETIGNNVLATQNTVAAASIAQVLQAGNQAKSQNFSFDFQFDERTQDPSQYLDASITNAFFVSNRYHDILYRYGFDERAGNFQNSNFGRGGQENDAVIAITQDGESKKYP